MVVHGQPWYFISNHGSLWSTMVSHGFWLCFVKWHHGLAIVRFHMGWDTTLLGYYLNIVLMLVPSVEIQPNYNIHAMLCEHWHAALKSDETTMFRQRQVNVGARHCRWSSD